MFFASTSASFLSSTFILFKVDNSILSSIMKDDAPARQEYIDPLEQTNNSVNETADRHNVQQVQDQSILLRMSRMTIDLFTVIFKKRRGHINKIVLVLFFSSLATQMSDSIDANIQYLYLKDKLGWSMTSYSNYASITSLIMALSTLLISPFLTYVISDILQTSIGMLGYVIYAYLCGAVPAGDSEIWKYYLYPAAVVTFLGPSVCIIARSYTALHIESNDLGKLFAILSFCQALVPLAISPSSAAIFSASLKSNNIDTGTIYFGLAFFQLIVFALTLMADHLSKRDGFRLTLEQEYMEEICSNSVSGLSSSRHDSYNETNINCEGQEGIYSLDLGIAVVHSAGRSPPDQVVRDTIFRPDVFGEIAEIESEKEAVAQLSIIKYLISKLDVEMP